MIGCRVVCGLAAVVLAASPAAAQTWTERVHVSVNAGVLSGTQDFTDRFEFEANLETGSTSVDYQVQGGFTFDAGLGYRIWKGLGAGASVSFFSSDNAAATTSSVPHPFFFNQPREVVGDATDIGRSETGVHIQAMYLLNPAGPLRVVLSGGPSFFSIDAGRRHERQRRRDFPLRHGGVRVGRPAGGERLGGGLQRRRRRVLDVQPAVRRRRPVPLLQSARSTLTRRTAGSCRWTPAACSPAAAFGWSSDGSRLRLTALRFHAGASSASFAAFRPAGWRPTATWRPRPGARAPPAPSAIS